MGDRDIIDDVLGFGSSFDWITPLYSMVRNAVDNGTNVTVDRDLMNYAKDIVERLGISSWGWSIMGDRAIFSVRKSDYPKFEREFTGR